MNTSHTPHCLLEPTPAPLTFCLQALGSVVQAVTWCQAYEKCIAGKKMGGKKKSCVWCVKSDPWKNKPHMRTSERIRESESKRERQKERLSCQNKSVVTSTNYSFCQLSPAFTDQLSVSFIKHKVCFISAASQVCPIGKSRLLAITADVFQIWEFTWTVQELTGFIWTDRICSQFYCD